MYKKTIVIFISMWIMCLCSGCFDVLNLNENAYLLAVGIDRGVAGKYRFSFQFAQPVKSMNEEKESKETSNSSEIVTIDASDIVTAIYSVKDFKSKRINGSHIKIVVFGSDIAREGISDLLASFIEPGQLRTNMYLAVAADTAAEYLHKVEPQTEIFLTKFYERQFDPMHGINMAAPRLYDTYFTIMGKKEDVVLPLVGVNKEKAMHHWLEEPRGYISGDIPRISENTTEMAGNAYFDGDVMQGVITQAEADIYFLLKGVYTFGYLTVPDPKEREKILVLNIEQSGKPKIKVNHKTNRVDINLSLNGVVYYGEGSFDYAKNISFLENYIESIYTQRCMDFVQKRQIENIDCLGLEKCFRCNFLTESEQERHTFDLKKLSFYIQTDIDIKRTGKLSGIKK